MPSRRRGRKSAPRAWVARRARVRSRFAAEQLADLHRAIDALETATAYMVAAPSGPDWVEWVAEAMFCLELGNPDRPPGNEPSVGSAILNALQDLKKGLTPEWMEPARVPPNRRPPAARDSMIRGAAVDCVRVLQEIFGYSERRACATVADHMPSAERVSAEAVRAWARSRRFITESVSGHLTIEADEPTEAHYLEALRSVCKAARLYPGARAAAK